MYWHLAGTCRIDDTCRHLGGIAMRSRLAVLILLLLLAVLPLMNVLAAPAPAPSAILDIGPPPKGWSMEKHREREISDYLTSPDGMLFAVWLDPEISKLPSVAAKKDARSWLSENIRVTQEDEGRRLRLKFRAGNRREQVTILSSLLHAYIQARKKKQKSLEKSLRMDEKCVLELKERIASGQHPGMVDEYKKGMEELRSIRIPARRGEIDRYKQIAVIRWAE
jgi:hypothetical protein